MKEMTPMVGDRVVCQPLPDGTGVLQEVLPRATVLQRPAVSNVDQMLVVATLRDPSPNLGLVDRLLVTAEFLGLDAVIAFNKSDLGSREEANALLSTYEPIGYTTLVISVRTQSGMGQLHSLLKNRVTVLAGQSGVGKSSLINLLAGGDISAIGEVSEKTGTGRHTTRHVELLALPGEQQSFIVDTPGFNRLELPAGLAADQLDQCFPEMQMGKHCRFGNSCMHLAEPGCAVKEALAAKLVAASRYNSYQLLYQELREQERKY